MKTVIHIIDTTPIISELPDDWIECSVTGEYRPPEEYRSFGKDYQTRTNCTKSYEMTFDLNKEASDKTKEIKKSREYKLLEKKLCNTQENKNQGIPVSVMIDSLMELLKDNPSARLVMTQEGYYCYDKFADVYLPEKLNGYKDLYVIGHSSQNC